MKKIFSITLVCILVSIMVGCTSGRTSKEAVNLRIGVPSGKDLTPMELVDSFKKANPNINIELDESPWGEFKRKLKMEVSVSNAPTVFIMDSGYVASLGGMGGAVDLSSRVKKDIKEEDYSKALFAGQDPEGHLWGIPHGLNSVAMYYNKALFDEAGIPYPDADWTFDELFEIAKKLTKDKNNDGIMDQYGFAYHTNITEGWLPFVAASGGAPLDETRKKSMFKDEKTIEGFKKFIFPQQSGIAPTLEWTSVNGNNTAAFYMGKIGILMTQSSGVNPINKNAPEGFKYDVQIMPIGWDGARHCVYVPNQWTIFSRATKAEQDAAWEWIKYFISDEGQMKVADTLLSGYPIKKSALEYISTKKTVPANMKAFYEGIDEYGMTIFENKTFEEWRPKVDAIAAELRRGSMGFEEGIDEIDKIVTEALEKE